MSETIKLHVGSIDEMGKRFIDAWQRLERSAEVLETNLTFFDLETMMSTLSPKRLALLRHVHQHPAKTVAELARTLGRDYKRIHKDVSVLSHAGLIVHDEQGVRTPYDSAQVIVSLNTSPPGHRQAWCG